tara:strand:- start:666 stop:1343 length:678 start_codon:yes stop_codon:yes gene_type:complete
MIEPLVSPVDHPEYWARGINIDITDKCVLACPRCMRQTKPGLHKRGRDLSPEDFRKIAKGFKNISWCGQMGDPIYHPNFHDLLDVAIQEKSNLSIGTNGFGKKDKWWDISYDKVNQIDRARWTFAVDGLPKDSHKYRVNQDGEAVWKQMCRAAKSGNDVQWQYIVFAYNENNISEAKKMAEDNGIRFLLLESSRWTGDSDPLRPSKHYIDRIMGTEIQTLGEFVK